MEEVVLLAIILLTIVVISVFLHYTYQIRNGKRLTDADVSTLVLVGTIALVVLVITVVWLLFVMFSPNSNQSLR